MDLATDADIEPLRAKALGYGVIRLYRQNENINKDTGDDDIFKKLNEISGDGTIIAIVAVPSYFTATDLLGFVGETARENVSHFRFIKSHTPNRFMVLMKFRTKKNALLFQDNYNGRKFNSMEPETCHVIFVKSILFRTDNDHRVENQSNSIPYLLDDPFMSNPKNSQSHSQSQLTVKPLPPPTPKLIELPTCPVCLERMDSSISGLLTIPCQHTFHCQCLSKWKDDTCPICRYTSLKYRKFDFNSNNINNFNTNEHTEDKCFFCGIQQNLWICLICGNIGCGRYDSGHAIEHFKETGHCFSMDINSQRVWDYAGDNYVHRLLTNEADGKLVELSSRNDCSFNANSEKNANGSNDSKVENMNLEYTHILVSQLESQREYFEDKISQFVDKNQKLSDENEQLEKSLSKLEASIKTIKEESLSAIESKMDKYSKLLTKNFEKYNELNKRYQEEKSMGEGLFRRIQKLEADKKKLADEKMELQTSNEDLGEQVKDLMFYLESQDKFRDAAEDVKEGTVVLQPPAKKHRSRNKKKR
ncbi:Etp1p [Ascoidea rubescens DSM 1968]|uniref:Zf-UBP-domain-containing protein n=1 Tax=Ascoidea rubescens DSM 1968 TaxID=1344418 RepID=A0A1D2VNL1_9ASCO|nr:zf-UBP-domain-containing protein [Ascoidea rubescens DSM 1968]ODV63186.1 zf-UBP-domain-containing protein [Ascoidea rubescens DSM 1968]